MAKNEHSFFGGLFTSRKLKTRAREDADMWAAATIAHMETTPRVFALSGYVAVMAPDTGLGWRLWFVSPRGNEMAVSSASLGGAYKTPDQLWAAHLEHFRQWVPEELANPRDAEPAAA